MNNTSLLSRIQASGISLEQSIKALSIITEIAKQKYPILEGSINSFLKKEFSDVDSRLIEKIIDNNQ
jgi:hypothetical protein